MIITVLGSCANQISNREGVSILFEDQKDNILVDCGPGIVAAFGRACRKTSEVNNLLLTHVHGDHVSGFAYFVWNRNFERMGMDPADDLHVYGAKDTLELAKFSLDHSYPELKFPFEIIYHEISNEMEQKFYCGNIMIETVAANHAVPCVSCVISANEKRVVYTSDSLPNENLVSYKNPDLLIHEGMMLNAMSKMSERVKHSLSSQAGKFATLINAKQLVLVHIAPVLLGKEKELLEESKAEFSGAISIPFDGTVYCV